MEKDSEDNHRKNELKLKLVKDFGFLLQLRPVPVNERVTKYLIKEGESEKTMRQDEENFDMVYSYIKYDYEGKTLMSVNCAKMSKHETKDQLMRDLLLGMKIKERAWFNICDYQVYRRIKAVSNQNQLQGQDNDEQDLLFDEDIPKIQVQHIEPEIQETKIQAQPQNITKKESTKQTQNEYQLIDIQPETRTGFHFQIFVERVQYKNSDNFDSKLKVVEQKKEEARAFFIDKKYEEASKVYVFLDAITSNLRKYKRNPQTGGYTSEPFYTNEQVLQLQSKNVNAKINYLKCFFKMIEKTSSEQKEIAKKYIDFLLEKQDENPVTHYLNAKWLLHERWLDSALEAAKRSRELERNKATEDLIALIQQEKANKHKIKVKVPA